MRMTHGWDRGEEGHTKATEAMKLVWEGLQQVGDEDKVTPPIQPPPFYKHTTFPAPLTSIPSYINKYRLYTSRSQYLSNARIHLYMYMTSHMGLHCVHLQDGKVSTDEWCRMWARSIENKENLNPPAWLLNYMSTLFDVNDSSRDDQLDMEEYTNVQMTFGLSKGNCDTAFQTFAPVSKESSKMHRKV